MTSEFYLDPNRVNRRLPRSGGVTEALWRTETVILATELATIMELLL